MIELHLQKLDTIFGSAVFYVKIGFFYCVF